MAITQSQIEDLKKAGYIVEDMGLEHGADFEGQYRWLLLGFILIDFQQHDGCFSSDEAWEFALLHFYKQS